MWGWKTVSGGAEAKLESCGWTGWVGWAKAGLDWAGLWVRAGWEAGWAELGGLCLCVAGSVAVVAV